MHFRASARQFCLRRHREELGLFLTWGPFFRRPDCPTMADRPTGSHGYSLQSQTSAPSALAANIQQQPTPPGQQQQQQQQPQQPQPQQQQQQMLSPIKDVNAVNVCRIGQEMVHDIVSKAQEIFQLLSPKGMQLNMNHTQYQEKKTKLDEALTHVSMQFRKLHVIHDKVLEITSQTEEPRPQQLVPEVGLETDPMVTSSNTEFYSLVVEQHREIVEQVRMKNQQLKEIIDQLRTIIWEINTMITMRKIPCEKESSDHRVQLTRIS